MVNHVGGAGNKWTKDTELDMLMAMMLDDDHFIKPNWTKVHTKMESWGHQYSKSSIQQHWNILLKNFRTRRGGVESEVERRKMLKRSKTITKTGPKETTETPPKAKGKRTRAAAKRAAGSGSGSKADDSDDDSKPVKRQAKKEEKKPKIKVEQTEASSSSARQAPILPEEEPESE